MYMVNFPSFHLHRGNTYANEGPNYDTKQSDSEVPVILEIWGMRSTSSMPLSQVHFFKQNYFWHWHCTYAKLNCLN